MHIPNARSICSLDNSTPPFLYDLFSDNGLGKTLALSKVEKLILVNPEDGFCKYTFACHSF